MVLSVLTQYIKHSQIKALNLLSLKEQHLLILWNKASVKFVITLKLYKKQRAVQYVLILLR